MPGPGAQIVVRARGDRRAVLAAVRASLKSYNPGIIISDLHAAYDDVARERDAAHARLFFLASVAALSLLLALIGVYSLVSYTMVLRLREIGIRVALGATDQRVVRVIVGDLWWMASLGTAFGLLLGSRIVLTLDRVARNPLLPPHLSVAVVPALIGAGALVVVSAVATLVPVRRALRMDIARIITAGG